MAQETYQIVLVGGGSVGKTCLAVRYLNGKFLPDYDPTIEQTFKKLVLIDNIPTNLHIIDTAGQDDYKDVRNKYIASGEGFVVVYSIIARSSFDEAKTLLLQIKKEHKSDVPVITVANKIDFEKERVVTVAEGEQLAKKFATSYFEVSAKTGQNTENCFESLVRSLRKKKQEITQQIQQPINNKNESSSGCCIIL
ncbi:ras-like protein [Anaeramoeba ignava]|uniref:Ras-like protein n=1 Tax=Anaeramoeba ignava TaxID=1746090 RepID=A0A9Q0R8S6_ANAIG|nr:ras-like protein [Anaeramoeba ignava]